MNVGVFKTMHVIYKHSFAKFKSESFNIKTFILYFLIPINWELAS